MKFCAAFQTLSAVTKTCSIPALSEVSASFFHNRCVLRATDMETWMQIELPAQGDAFDFLFQDSGKTGGMMKGKQNIRGMQADVIFVKLNATITGYMIVFPGMDCYNIFCEFASIQTPEVEPYDR